MTFHRDGKGSVFVHPNPTKPYALGCKYILREMQVTLSITSQVVSLFHFRVTDKN